MHASLEPILAALPDPLAVLQRWPSGRRLMLLHSGRPHPRWSRRTLLAPPRGVYRFLGEPGCSQWEGPADTVPVHDFTHQPFHDLRLLLSAAPDALWMGHLSYDLGRWVEHLPRHAADDRQWPVIELSWCPAWLEYDLFTSRWAARGRWTESDIAELAALPPSPPSPPSPHDYRADHLQSVFDRRAYEQAVQRTMDYIAAGDIFQANLAQRFTAAFSGPHPHAGRALFTALAQGSPAWYGAYLDLAPVPGQPRRTIASTSPELFLEVTGRHVVTRPIKGTRPAHLPASTLIESEKDTAELNMIVDLMRNDLGRVCDYGSIRVSEPRTVESHPTVHHGVATIEGDLHPGKDVIDLLRAAMPGGSITGAPKVRAMQIIDELEPVRRGPYCGVIGCLSAQHTCLNIAIRTMLIEQPLDGSTGRVDFSVGGGIVADSSPAGEYDETLDKAAAMLRALRLPLPSNTGM